MPVATCVTSGSGPSSVESSRQSEGSAKQPFAAALAAYQAQHYDQAQNILAPLARSNPSSFEINELLGLVFVAQGEDQKANPFLGKAVRLKPNVTEARTALATNLLRLHRTVEAESQFKKAVALAPLSYEPNHNLGEFYIQTGALSKAIAFLKRAQEIDPKAENNGYDLALACEKTGDLEQARRQLLFLMRFQDSAELHSLLGEIEEKSKNYLASAAQYEQAVRLDPSEQNLFDWGSELLLHQTFEPAVEVFKAGLVRFPQSARLQLGLGIALYGNGSYDDGASAFLHASDMNPSDPLPLTFAAKAYENLSPTMAEQVRSRLQTFLDKNPDNAPVRYFYALCLWKLNEKEPNPDVLKRVESLLKRVVTIAPTYADAYLQLGIVYANEGRNPEAIMTYEKALKLSPNLPNLHYRLGQALMRTGNAVRARDELATFERLRQSQVEETNKQNAEVQQFVYTMRNAGTGR